MESEPMLTPREISPLPEENLLRGGSNRRRCIKQDSAPNTLPTSYSGPLNSIHGRQATWRDFVGGKNSNKLTNKQENKIVNVDLHSDIFWPFISNFVWWQTSPKPYCLIPVWMNLADVHGHGCKRKQKLLHTCSCKFLRWDADMTCQLVQDYTQSCSYDWHFRDRTLIWWFYILKTGDGNKQG